MSFSSLAGTHLVFPMRVLLTSAVLALQVSSLLSGQVLESVEPNDSAASATVLPCGVHGYGTLTVGGDRDLWAFTTTGVTDVVAYTTSRGAVEIALDPAGSSVSDTILELLDVDGVSILAENDDHLSERSFEESGFFSSVRVRALPAGTYYLGVRGWNPVERGDYAVEVYCHPSAGPLVFCPQILDGVSEVEPNDTLLDAGVVEVSCCERVFGSLPVMVGGGGDIDLWFLRLVEDMSVVIDLIGDTTNGNPLVDPEVLLFASDGTSLVGSDDDSGLALNARLEQVVAAGEYFLGVRGVEGFFPGYEFGDYSLAVDCAPSTAPLLGTFVVDVDAMTCPTSSGESLRVVPRRNEFPQIGGQFTLDIDGLTAIPPVMLLSIDSPPTVPIDLGLVGAPGCVLAVIPVLSALDLTPSIPGEAEFGFPIPVDNLNIGAFIEFQAVAIDLSANPFGLVTSNRVSIVVGTDG